MAKGASKISGGGGGAAKPATTPTTYDQQEQDLIRGIVADMTRPYDPANPNNTLTRSDAQAMVEAFAMTHPQADENQIMDAIDSAVFVLKNGTTAPATRTATLARTQNAATQQSAIPANQVSVSVSQFVGANGTSPRGSGTWAFDIGGETVFFSGKYSDAKKRAIKQAASRGVRSVKLQS